MDQEEHIGLLRADKKKYTMMNQQTMDQEEQIEISPVEEKQLTVMSQRSMNQEQQIKMWLVEEEQLTMKRQRLMKQIYKHRLAMMILSTLLQADPAGLLNISRYENQHVQVGTAISSMLSLYAYLCSRVLSSMWSRFAGTENYIISASVVITAYGKLLRINTRYINIIIVPIVILFFIAALWNKFWSKSWLKKDGAHVKHGVSKKVDELLVVTALPYYALCFEELFGGSLAMSQFLWFLSSSLGAVAVMIALLPAAASPAGAQVLQLLYRTCIIVLTVTLHTKAAELAMEDMALVCTPELVTVLVWFAIRFRLGVGLSYLSKYVGLSRQIIVAVYFLVFAFITSPAYGYQWRIRALRACSFSGCLTYFSMCMLRRWPRSKPVSQVPFKLLEFFAKICFRAAAVLAVMSAGCGHFITFMLLYGGQVILLSVHLFLFFLLLGPAEKNRQFLRYLDRIAAGVRRLIYLNQRLQGSLNQRLKQFNQYLSEKLEPFSQCSEQDTSPAPSRKYKTQ